MCPSRPLHPCAHPGCPELVGNTARCPAHTKDYWHARSERPEIKEDKKFYDSAAWRKFRLMILRKEPWCRECRRNGMWTPALVVDHVVRLRLGGSKLSESNVQPLCRECDQSRRARQSHGNED